MLKNFGRIWFHRFKFNQPSPPPLEEQPSSSIDTNMSPWLVYLCTIYSKVHVNISFENVGPLTADDIPLSAIDFHCSSMVYGLIDE